MEENITPRKILDTANARNQSMQELGMHISREINPLLLEHLDQFELSPERLQKVSPVEITTNDTAPQDNSNQLSLEYLTATSGLTWDNHPHLIVESGQMRVRLYMCPLDAGKVPA